MSKHTLQKISCILKDVKYKDFSFRVLPKGDGFLLQSQFICPTSGPQSGRKWYVSPYMTKSEIVQTVFKAVLTIEEHETREAFKYKDVSVFGPHHNIDQLVKFSKEEDQDCRS